MLTAKDAEFYRENGYVTVPGIIPPEMVEDLRGAADAAIARMNAHKVETNKLWGGEWLSKDERGAQVVDAIHDPHFHDAAFFRLVAHRPFIDALVALLGPNVQLHHSKLLAKPAAKGGGFPMHQDYPYFPHERHTMLACSIYLDDADEENGCIRVVPGTHKLGPMACDPGGYYLPPKDYPVAEGVPCNSKAGDAVIFNYLTVHGSEPNRSPRPRRNILIQARDPEDLPTNEHHQSRGQGMMLAGINPIPVPARWDEKKPAAAKA